MIKITLADDHALVRVGLNSILQKEGDIKVVGEAANYHEILALLSVELPDIALLDITMPGRDGLDVLKEIRSLYPSLRVLIVSMLPEDPFGIRAIKAGAYGYMSKGNTNEELVSAIRRIYNGNKYISNTLAEKLADVVEKNTDKPAHEALSNRELQILCMIASGKVVRDIAGELSLSPATVASYRARILTKLQLRSNVELTAYAHRNHLVD